MTFLRPILRATTQRGAHLTRSQAPARTLTSTRCMRLKEDKPQSPQEVEAAKQEQMKTGKKKEELESASESVVGADRQEVGNHDEHIKELQQEGAKEKQREHPEGKSVHTPMQSSTSSSITGAVLLYLPCRPSTEDSADDASNISVLQSTLNAHVVKINYRASDKAQFPTPTHDVLAGYDWVVSNLLAKRAITRPGRSEYVDRIAVCGEGLGGGLATALALTECRIGELGIVAAAVNNPIIDWVELGEKARDKWTVDQESELQELLKQRNGLFRKPEHYYDPFASPMLFFRSAGVGVPEQIEEKPTDEMDELSRLERMEYLHEHGVSVDLANPETLEDSGTIAKTRKASRRYPSKALGLRLPSFHVAGGNGSVLSKSTMELVMQLRKSYERQIDSGVLRSASAMGEVSADTMLQHEQCAGRGSWDVTESGRNRMQQVAGWLAQKLSV